MRLFQIPIIEYLDEAIPKGPRLLPKNQIDRLNARCIAEIINAGIQPYQNVPVWKFLPKEKNQEWLQYFNTRGLNAVEEMLKKTAGKYCVGDEISIADLCLVPQVYAAIRFKVDLNDFNNIKRVNSELAKLPEYINSHPSKTPDCPPESR